MPTADDFRLELRAQISRAQEQNRPHVEINAGELHRLLGSYPGPDHRMHTCCNVMYQEAELLDHEIIVCPQQGNGASLTIRYFV